MFESVFHIIISSFVGTSIMTLFTYIVGKLAQKDLGEPEYLNRLIRLSRRFEANTKDNHIAGWAIHYATGLIFVLGMDAFRSITGVQLTVSIGLVLGGILGMLGVIGWITMFRIHHNPPSIDFPVFLIQLVAAHILFGWTVSRYFQFFNM